MAKMRAIDAAVRILEKEGVVCAFGVPGAAINPLYSDLKGPGSINHILARNVEGASQMAEGYTRARAGNIGVCIGTSGPAGTDMITGLYSEIADSIPILCITGQAPRARIYKEDFQAVDIEPTQIGRTFNADLGIVSDAKAALELLVTHAKEWRKAGKLMVQQALPAQLPDSEVDDVG